MQGFPGYVNFMAPNPINNCIFMPPGLVQPQMAYYPINQVLQYDFDGKNSSFLNVVSPHSNNSTEIVQE